MQSSFPDKEGSASSEKEETPEVAIETPEGTTETSDAKGDDTEVSRTMFLHSDVVEDVKLDFSLYGLTTPVYEASAERASVTLKHLEECLRDALGSASSQVRKRAEKQSGKVPADDYNPSASSTEKESQHLKYKEYIQTCKADKEIFQVFKGISFKGTSLLELTDIGKDQQQFLEIWDRDNKLLVQATCKGDDAMVSKLLKEYADPDAYDETKENDTVLITASANGNDAIVSALLAAGANTDLQNICGYTALMQAAKNGHLKIAEMLVAAGAKVKIVNESRESALDLARTEAHSEVISFLESVLLTTSSESSEEVISHGLTTQHTKSTTEDEISHGSTTQHTKSTTEDDEISHGSTTQHTKSTTEDDESMPSAGSSADDGSLDFGEYAGLELVSDNGSFTPDNESSTPEPDLAASSTKKLAIETVVNVQTPDSSSVATECSSIEANVVMAAPESSSVEADRFATQAESGVVVADTTVSSAELPSTESRESSESPEKTDLAV